MFKAGPTWLTIGKAFDHQIRSSNAIGSNSLNTVMLDYPSEFITGVSGKYRGYKSYSKKQYLRSITFHTNKSKYGPFEASPVCRPLETETEFHYDIGPNKFCGFFGTYLCDGIESIGIYVKPIEKLPNNPITKEAI
ncbi:inactive protein RESTRICTED TEV MOVEMENT 1-like [Heracleum sosnowskyi]|uniref:Inactive protein RESTRICTED TEV MOVEMENT 1-like n=1 Tax=Heracleum sosnowskyi TaxID=360622 RepID=A0AAD8LWX3_9APIA|nr:inactive protein RESTRICTED TEV MOVEMENT 1-like [Heracleum sosnowskyi]